MARRAEPGALLALVAAALVATGCGGSKPTYGEQAQAACATVPAQAGADPARTDAAGRAALKRLRAIRLPSADRNGAERLTAQRLVENAGEQQAALDQLVSGLRTGAGADTLRGLAHQVTERSALVRTPAHALAAPACGTGALAAARTVQAQDYAVTMHRATDELAYVERRLPRLRSGDHARLVADADRAADQFDQLAGRLEPLEPPPGTAPVHGRLLDALYALRDEFVAVGDRVRHGQRLDLAAAAARHRRTYAGAQDDWRALAARLPRVPERGSPWGPADGRAQAAAALRKTYIKTMREELFLFNSHEAPGGHASAAQWRRVGRVVVRTRSRLLDLRAPAAVAATQRLMLQGFTSFARTATTIAGALDARSYPQALRAERLARRGLAQLRTAQRRFRAAGYRFHLGVGNTGGGGGGASGASPNTTLS